MRHEWLVPLVRIAAVAALSVGVAAFLWISSGSQRFTPVSAAAFQIQVGDFWFCDSSNEGGICVTEIGVNDEVTWLFASTTHTTTACTGPCGGFNPTPLWDSGDMSSDTFTETATFNSPGTFEYQCDIHPSFMRGTIIVGGGAPTSTVPPPAPTETETPIPTLPIPPSPAPSVTATSVPSTATATPVAPSDTATAVPASTDTPTPTATPAGLLGDTNNDGVVNAIDAALVLQFGAGFIDSLPNGDVNDDGTINAIDAALILQFIAGLLPSL